jgi:hypothetical protein
MMENYLTAALRYLLRHKSYTTIHVCRLAAGFAPCLPVMLFVRWAWRFNRLPTHSGRAWLEENCRGEGTRHTATPVPLTHNLQRGL